VCCRYQLSQEHYRRLLAELGIETPAEFVSRYNIAPGSSVPVVRTATSQSGREVVSLRWGLTPAWAKADEPPARLVNARAETLEAKPSFRDALRSRRCVLPASGFFEWEIVGRARSPWLFRWRDESPFGLAGLWDSWRSPAGEVVESCAVVTVAPNDLMRPIHHRMPVMLTPTECRVWLDLRAAAPAGLSSLLRSPETGAMTGLRVNSCVNSVQQEGPQCIEPAEAATLANDGRQLSLEW
jgi:putative SOS response-associated peptidase YedK